MSGAYLLLSRMLHCLNGKSLLLLRHLTMLCLCGQDGVTRTQIQGRSLLDCWGFIWGSVRGKAFQALCYFNTQAEAQQGTESQDGFSSFSLKVHRKLMRAKFLKKN